MITLFTDFGWLGPYVGQLKLVLRDAAPTHVVIDLMHDAPRFQPRASAYLLAALAVRLPQNAVTVAVVDPGVGSAERRPVVVEANQRWYVGPDNGLLNVVARQAETFKCWEINWRPVTLSHTFHGRDLFAPVAARLVTGQALDMTSCTLAEDPAGWPADLAEVIYIDGFGNAATGFRGSRLAPAAQLVIEGKVFHYAPTFAAVARGEAFWTINANGLVELAINQGDVSAEFGLAIGTPIEIRDG
ncbi:MAG: SAM hydrolase/SAM-dependent halogenase family protein [Alphaproteobacteria bacterium]